MDFMWGEGREDRDPYRGMDKEELLERTQAALEEGLEWMGKVGAEWQSDAATDKLARDMVASGTILLDSLKTAVDTAQANPKDVNPLVLALAIKTFEAHMGGLAMLHSLAALRMGGDQLGEDE